MEVVGEFLVFLVGFLFKSIEIFMVFLMRLLYGDFKKVLFFLGIGLVFLFSLFIMGGCYFG